MDDKGVEVVETSPKGRFVRFNRKLGSGAYKCVYLGFDNDTGREIAWNVISFQMLSKSERRRISEEITIAKSLDHQRIITFVNAWINKQKEEVVFITERVTGGSLRSYVNRVGQNLRLKVIRNWCRQILEGLVYLHGMENPVIHRDLKCDNIFINGNVGEVLIGDLGLSTSLKHSCATSIVGTPEFMAPELYEEQYGTPVDIYAFGMCLLEMVSRTFPYSECQTAGQIYKKVVTGEKPLVLKRIKDEQLRKIVEQCLQVEPEARPSAQDLLAHPFLEDNQEDDDQQCDLIPENEVVDSDDEPDMIRMRLNATFSSSHSPSSPRDVGSGSPFNGREPPQGHSWSGSPSAKLADLDGKQRAKSFDSPPRTAETSPRIHYKELLPRSEQKPRRKVNGEGINREQSDRQPAASSSRPGPGYRVTGTGVTGKNMQGTPGGSSATPLPNNSADGDSSILSQNDYREPSANVSGSRIHAQPSTSSAGNVLPDLTDDALQGRTFPPPEVLQSLGQYNVRVLDSITLNMSAASEGHRAHRVVVDYDIQKDTPVSVARELLSGTIVSADIPLLDLTEAVVEAIEARCLEKIEECKKDIVDREAALQKAAEDSANLWPHWDEVTHNLASIFAETLSIPLERVWSEGPDMTLSSVCANHDTSPPDAADQTLLQRAQEVFGITGLVDSQDHRGLGHKSFQAIEQAIKNLLEEGQFAEPVDFEKENFAKISPQEISVAEAAATVENYRNEETSAQYQNVSANKAMHSSESVGAEPTDEQSVRDPTIPPAVCLINDEQTLDSDDGVEWIHVRGNRFPSLSINSPRNHPITTPVTEWLQISLVTLQSNDDERSSFKEMGVFCKNTEEAVQSFQRNHNMRDEHCTGVTDKKFWGELMDSLEKYLTREQEKIKKRQEDAVHIFIFY